MANITPTLITSQVPFSQAQQLQNQVSPQTSSSMQQQIVQSTAGTTQNRSRVKNRSASNASNISLNGIPNLQSQPIFGTSVAFPGNPLQTSAAATAAASGQIQTQNYQHQTRLAPMQHATGQQGGQAVLVPLEINPNQTRNLVANSSGANVITSNNAAAVAAAVAVAHPQYSQYINSWPCPACKIAFRSANELQTHLSAHFVPSHPQPHQQHQTKQQNNQSTSSLASSNTLSNTTFNLNTNSKTSAAKNDQSVHMKKDKSVPCQECGKLFANAERVRVHVKVAHGEKTCSCTICGCGFSYRCKLLNHMRTHTGDKPFTCEVCGRSFSQKNHLKRHHMIHTGERPFPCEICGRSFYRKDKLTRHLRIHTNPNPGRGRNSKAAATINQPIQSGLKLPMTSQSIQSLPTIQFLPVMTQIKTSTSDSGGGSITGGQLSWASIQSTSNRQNNQNDIKSNESQQQQQQQMMKEEPN
ncbi:Gastrula zinc finger protein XlCGF26.1 [Sarcoptes scabiei]|nr:Gastrula zinc finger protein XlCGF26.1 [Sarcoptes scabiei]